MIAQRVLMTGNDAIAAGAIAAGCRAFFGYPITPQSEILEYLARELPKVGGVFMQSECELSAAGMTYGAAYTGTRAMTASSGPGISLMQEFISFMAFQSIPVVIVNVSRSGPGSGTTGLYGQMDYMQSTKGGGHGGYRCIVLAPFSSQECYDLVQLAFHLSDKYRMVVLVLSDGLIGHSSEEVDLRTLDFGPLPEKEWALERLLTGQEWIPVGHPQSPVPGPMPGYPEGVAYFMERRETHARVKLAEVRYDTYRAEDAELLLIAYGYVARMAAGAVDLAREAGIKAGLLRPITLWPFPEEAIREAAVRVGKVLVVEDSPGLMVEDVEAAVRAQVPVHLLGVWAHDRPGMEGLIYAERIFDEIRSLT